MVKKTICRCLPGALIIFLVVVLVAYLRGYPPWKWSTPAWLAAVGIVLTGLFCLWNRDKK